MKDKEISGGENAGLENDGHPGCAPTLDRIHVCSSCEQ